MDINEREALLGQLRSELVTHRDEYRAKAAQFDAALTALDQIGEAFLSRPAFTEASPEPATLVTSDVGADTVSVDDLGNSI